MAKCLPAIILLTLALAAAVVPAGASPVSAHTAGSCADVGPPQSDVGLYKIWAQRLSCGRARSILKKWYYDRSAPDSGPSGWACRTFSRGQYTLRTYCFQGRKKISYTRYLA